MLKNKFFKKMDGDVTPDFLSACEVATYINYEN